MRYRIHPDALANRIGDQIVVVQMQTDRIFELNRTGARIWELLAEGRSRAEIEGMLTEEFELSGSSATIEIDQLIASLKNENLITLDDEN